MQAIAANARLAMSSGGTYLLASLTPATPPDRSPPSPTPFFATSKLASAPQSTQT